MKELFSHLKQLNNLKLSCSPDNWIETALKGLQKGTNNNILIKKICIEEWLGKNGSVAMLAKYCPLLQSLSVNFDIDEESLLALSTFCPLLKEPNILRFPRITTEIIAIQCVPTLSCIHSISISDYTPNLNIILPYLKELQYIAILTMITHIPIHLLTQNCMKLISIEISFYSTTTFIQLLQLVQNCIFLHTIDIYNNMEFNDEFMIELAKSCLNLQRLSIYSTHTSTTDITDTSLITLSKNCPKLQELIISKCCHLTEATVLYMLQNCKNLRRLVLPYTCLYYEVVYNIPYKVSIDNNDTVTYTASNI